MQSSRERDLDTSSYMAYNCLQRLSTHEEADRIAVIKGTSKEKDGPEVLRRTIALIQATVLVKRKMIWDQQSELYGQYPANQQDEDQINWVDREVEALNHNPEIDYLKKLVGEIQAVLVRQQQKKDQRLVATLYPPKPRQPDRGQEVTPSSGKRQKQ